MCLRNDEIGRNDNFSRFPEARSNTDTSYCFTGTCTTMQQMNTNMLLSRTVFSLVLALLLATGCARLPDLPAVDAHLFLPPAPQGTDTAQVPAFLIEKAGRPYNRIGTPAASATNGDHPRIIVDPATATVYHERQTFTTAQGTYTNEVYRVHFEKVPFGWGAFNLTAGNNPGLLIIYTLDDDGVPLLITTVHTCGCYLAFLPTTALKAAAYPPGWPTKHQWIYGQTLPAQLPVPVDQHRVVFTVIDQTHRIGWAEVIKSDELTARYEQVHADLAPLQSLNRLPFEDTTVSFFETEGPRAGYVKNNTKPLERLLIGWWAFDFRVGEDKAFLGGDTSTIPLYTSLKFWAREASDLKDFPRFLAYWGWDF